MMEDEAEFEGEQEEDLAAPLVEEWVAHPITKSLLQNQQEQLGVAVQGLLHAGLVSTDPKVVRIAGAVEQLQNTIELLKGRVQDE